jgi:hypothetical protein
MPQFAKRQAISFARGVQGALARIPLRDWIYKESRTQPHSFPHFNFFRKPEHQEGRIGGSEKGGDDGEAVAFIEALGADIFRIHDQPGDGRRSL